MFKLGIYDNNSDYNKYKIFYAVAEVNSFSKAVDVLHISQPAISYAIKELEAQLDTQLFIRENRKIKLTDDGERLMFYLRRAFNDINIAESLIKEKKKEYSGIVRIGMYQHLSLFILPSLLEEFVKNNPEAKFEVITSSSNELKEKLKNRELDFIITQFPLLMDDSNVFTEEKVFELENCFFTTKEYKKLYDEGKLDKLQLILPFRGYVDIDTLDKLLSYSNIKVINNYRIYTFSIIKKLVERNMGIGWGPKKCIESELKNKELYEIFLDFDTPITKFSMTYNEKALNTTAKEFINFFKKNINNLVKFKR